MNIITEKPKYNIGDKVYIWNKGELESRFVLGIRFVFRTDYQFEYDLSVKEDMFLNEEYPSHFHLLSGRSNTFPITDVPEIELLPSPEAFIERIKPVK